MTRDFATGTFGAVGTGESLITELNHREGFFVYDNITAFILTNSHLSSKKTYYCHKFFLKKNYCDSHAPFLSTYNTPGMADI